MIDVGQGVAEVPEATPQGRPITMILTSAVDVARFVAAAVELGIETWPREWKMRGARLTTQRLHEICSEVRGGEWYNTVHRVLLLLIHPSPVRSDHETLRSNRAVASLLRAESRRG